MAEEWRSCFYHPRLKLYLVLYVDDFKMSGPTENLAEGWALIEKGIDIDPAEPTGFYLGCNHHTYKRTHPVSGKEVTVVEYEMEDFLKSSVERYKELAKNPAMTKVPTPFLEESGPVDQDGYGCGYCGQWSPLGGNW